MTNETESGKNGLYMSEPLMDTNSAKETYKFLNALLDDYNACKTDLARSGILKVYRMLVGKVSEDHLKQIEEASKFAEETDKLAKELADTKAKLPKTKEEITKLLHEAGFHELEECDNGTWPVRIFPDLSPKAYAELYKKYYGTLKPEAEDNPSVPPRFDPAADSFEDLDKLKKTCNEAMARIAGEETNTETVAIKESNLPATKKKNSKRKSSKKKDVHNKENK